MSSSVLEIPTSSLEENINRNFNNDQIVDEGRMRNIARNIITMVRNPHPITVMIGTIFAIMIIALIIGIVLSPNINGSWMDENEKTHKIEKSKFSTVYLSDSIKIKSDSNDDFVKGKLKGNVLYFGEDKDQKVGVWKDNEIFIIDSEKNVEVWKRVLTQK